MKFILKFALDSLDVSNLNKKEGEFLNIADEKNIKNVLRAISLYIPSAAPLEIKEALIKDYNWPNYQASLVASWLQALKNRERISGGNSFPLSIFKNWWVERFIKEKKQ